MAIPVKCEACSYAFRVGDQAAGKRGKCPKCGAVISVPALTNTADVSATDWSDVTDEQPMPITRKATAKPALAQSGTKVNVPTWVWLAAGGGAALILLLVVVLVVVLMRGGASSPAVAKPAIPATPAAAQSTAAATPAVPAAAPAPKFKVVKAIDEVTNAVVKFEIPTPPTGMSTGSGFIINDRGWVATNYHVASQMNTAARAKFFNGQAVEIAGIIAEVPNRDLAIVKLKEMPAQSMILDIGLQERPKIGTRVFTYGSPTYADFTLCQGIVSRVLTHSEYLNGRPAAASNLKAPPDQVWIQTDAKMAPGNSGGPLLDETCRVLGVNTFVTPAASYASFIKYLREVADTSSDNVRPLKAFTEKKPELPTPQAGGAPGGAPQQGFAVPTKDSLQKMFDAAEAMSWSAQKPEDYKILTDLATAMTVAKQPKVPAEAGEMASQLFDKMKTLDWPSERLKQYSQYAGGRLTPNQGIVTEVVLLEKINMNGQMGWLVRIQHTAVGFLAFTGSDTLTLAKGSRALLLGIALPQTSPVAIGASPAVQLRHVLAPYVVPLKD